MTDQSRRWPHESTGRAVALASALASLATMLFALPGSAQEPVQTPVVLDPVVITATRKSERSFDVPVAIDRIGADTIQNG
jgi:hypothetical protein